MNADIRYYIIHGDQSRTLSRVNTRHVGRNISTKAIGSNQREDITQDYKFKEGSTSERAALLGGLPAHTACELPHTVSVLQCILSAHYMAEYNWKVLTTCQLLCSDKTFCID